MRRSPWRNLRPHARQPPPHPSGGDAVRLYDQMRADGAIPSTSVIVAALKSCTAARDARIGARIHSDMAQRGEQPGIFVSNTLIDMYSKCANLVEARRVFDAIPSRSLVSWNAIILGSAQCGHGESALDLFQQMQDQGFSPDARTYVAAFKACASLASKQACRNQKLWLEQAMAIHARLACSGVEPDVYVASSLVDMYSKFGKVAEARKVFDTTLKRDVGLWNSMIMGYAQSGESEAALELLDRMHESGLEADGKTYVAALTACSKMASRESKEACLERGKRLHARLGGGLESDRLVMNSLLEMYVKCGEMVSARSVFDRMVQQRDVVSWNLIIAGYAQGGDCKMAVSAFRQMQEEGVQVDSRTFVAVVGAISTSAAREESAGQADERLLGRFMHGELVRSGFDEDIFVASALVVLYSKLGSLDDACRVFDRTQTLDLVTWNAIIQGSCQDGRFALRLLQRLQDEGLTPNGVTFVAVISACVFEAGKDDGKQLFWLSRGREIHMLLKQMRLETPVGNALIDLYSRCGSIKEARGVFDEMQQHDLSSWNTVIKGYVQNGDGETALELFALMKDRGFCPGIQTFMAALSACSCIAAKETGQQVEGRLVKLRSLEKVRDFSALFAASQNRSDVFIASSFVDLYSKCGSMEEAFRIFNRMPCHNAVTWNAILLGYVLDGLPQTALELYRQMKERAVPPNAPTYAAVLKACGNLGALECGQEIHEDIAGLGMSGNKMVANSLISFYGRCGCMKQAQEIFDSVSGLQEETVAWNSLMTGYSNQGDTRRVFELFEVMQRRKIPGSGLTFLSLLTVCSHAGLVDEGKKYFEMLKDSGICPTQEHYNCMVDMLGRCNRLDEAVEMLKKMPMTPGLNAWKSVLAASWKWKNLEVAKVAFEAAVKLDKADAAPYVLMANTVSS